MEWLDTVVLALRWAAAAFLVYGAYLCLLPKEVFHHPLTMRWRPSLRVLALGCGFLVLSLMLSWRPPSLAEPQYPESKAVASGFLYPAPAVTPGGDGEFQVSEYH